MPKQYLQLSNFSGGLNTKFDGRDIKDDEITNVSNLQVYKPGQLFSITPHAQVTTRAGTAPTAGYGIFLFKSDTGIDNAAGLVEMLALADATESQIDIISDPFGSPSATSEIDLGSTSGGKYIYYYVDGALRTVDANGGGANTANWYGFIKRGSSAFNGTINNWVTDANNLARPAGTNCDITETGSAVTAATSGAGFDIDVTITTTDDDGLWEATTYEFAQSFVYEGDQESLLTVYTQDVTLSTNNYFTNVYISGKSAFADRIKGGRIYIRKKGSNDLWTLFVDIDFERGIRKDLGAQDYSDWSATSGSASNSTAFTIKGPSIDTYESINGFSPDVGHNSFASGALSSGTEADKAGLFYKTVTICNMRTFVANVNYYKSTGSDETKEMPDRILYTPIGKYDTFLPNQFIDIGINDGEDFTALESFGTKILAFKDTTLYIIDVTSHNDAEWFLESTHNGLGVNKPSAVVKTEFGVCWARKTGIYAWAPNQGIVELSAKLDKSSAPMSGLASPVVGYYPSDSQLLIVQDCTQASDALVYDFATKSFTELGAYTTAAVSNIQNDVDNAIFSQGTSIRKYDSSQGQSAWALETKDFHFGNPGVLKRPLKLIVSYSSTTDATITTTYYKDGDGDAGGDSSHSLDASTWVAADNGGVKSISLKGIGSVSSLKLKFSGASVSGGCKINDITISYRTTRKEPSTGVN